MQSGYEFIFGKRRGRRCTKFTASLKTLVKKPSCTKLLNDIQISSAVAALHAHGYRPVKAKPVKVFINGGGIFGAAARLIDIFNAQKARDVVIKAESLRRRMGMTESKRPVGDGAKRVSNVLAARH